MLHLQIKHLQQIIFKVREIVVVGVKTTWVFAAEPACLFLMDL